MEVLKYRSGEQERKKLKMEALESPKSRRIIEEKEVEVGESEE